MAKKKSLDETLISETKGDVLGNPEPAEVAQQPMAMSQSAPEIESSETGIINMKSFSKIDIRVGRILDVEDVPGARKPMYKLRVDLGEVGIRTIVAGIGGYYTKDELVDKRIVVVTNLEPRSIAGQMSQGMLLAAEDGDVVSVLSPDRNVKAGSAVR